MYMLMLQAAVPPSDTTKILMEKNGVSVQAESVVFIVSDLDDVIRLSKNGINMNGNNVPVAVLREVNELQNYIAMANRRLSRKKKPASEK